MIDLMYFLVVFYIIFNILNTGFGRRFSGLIDLFVFFSVFGFLFCIVVMILAFILILLF